MYASCEYWIEAGAELIVLPGIIKGKDTPEFYVNNHVLFETVPKEYAGALVLTREEAAEIDYAIIMDFFLEHLVSD